MVRLAIKDYGHEFLLSACAVLGLAAVLTPLLVLYGVKFGVVQTLTERLRNDPRNLEISPVISGKYTPEYLAQLAAHPDVAFVLPRTRSIAATMDLSSNETDSRAQLVASLEPTAAGDPLLLRFGAAAPSMPQNPASEAIGVTLSASAAEKLHVKQGDTLNGKVERRFQGKVQTARVALRVAAVLALVGVVVAEFMGASQGLGAVVIAAQGMMDTTLMFAALVLIAALGLLLYQLCLLLERRLLRGHQGAHSSSFDTSSRKH